MPLPVTIVAAYLVINFVLVVWIAREEARGRGPSPSVTVLARTLRYGPPLLGIVYLVTRAGDWPFFLFVLGFFGLAFWMLDRLLSFPNGPPPKR